jgi:pyruvate dehydrogenase complex dehydrogenase (E1) component
MADWHDIESAREQWGDAEHISDELLEELLEVARNDVMSYARKVDRDAYDAATEEEPFDVPGNLRMAQRRQAENIWNATVITNPAGGTGGGDFILQPHPLDWHIKQLIRPRRAVPRVR